MSAPFAVILAAGAGRRMWPFGVTQSKALLPVGARPLLTRTVEQLRAAGCDELCLVSGGPHDRALRGQAVALDLPVVAAPAPGGTADALLAAWPGGGARRPVLAIYGDVSFAAGVLPRLLAAAAERPAAVHLLAVPLGPERPQDWLCVDCDPATGRVHRLWGHPRGGAHRVGGAFVLPPGFDHWLRANRGQGLRVPVGGMPPADAPLEESINLFLDDIAAAAAGAPVAADGAAGAVGRSRDAREPGALAVVGEAVDLDRPWHILEANAAELRERFSGAVGVRGAERARVAASADVRAPVILEPGAELGERVIVRAPLYLCAGARVTDGAIIAGPTLVGPGARVSDYARVAEVVIGAGAVVGHAAEVSGVVMEGAHIVHYSEIDGVVGRQVDIGAATVCGTLRFDDGDSRQRVGGPGGRWETPAAYANASYFGDYSRTGVNVTLQPGRAIGPYACVGAAVLVTEDVADRTLVLLQQQLVSRPWGPERYGW